MACEFAVNDYVVYGKSGLCIVKEIKQMSMAGGPLAQYYILGNAYENDVTIYVPCDKDNLVAKMRRPMTKEEIDNVLEHTKGQEINWIENSIERADYFKQIADSENYSDWLLLAACLHLRKTQRAAVGKHLAGRDESMLRLLEKLIEQEFCYSLQLKPEQLGRYIQERL